MLISRKYILVILFVFSGTVKGQILDDTTQLVYGPGSTRYTTEEDLRLNAPRYRIIDTTLFETYKKSKVELNNYYYQNLGIEGTALRPVFYELPENIGVSPGANGFAPFYKTPFDITYYDTRSPYSRLTLFLGGGNRSITDVEFSRSDSVNFNFGFNYKTFAIDKQIQRVGRGDRRATSTQYDVYAHVRSNNLKYQLMANFTRNRQVVFESGGIDTTEIGNFFDKDVGIFLNEARSEELRQGLHLYHQYSIKEFLEVYNSIGTFRQRNEFIDQNLSNNASYYDTFLISDVETLDSTDYKHSDLEIGLKGNIGKYYYNIYAKRRNYDFINKYADSIPLPFDPRTMNRSGRERYSGFHTGYRFTRDLVFMAGLEVLEGGLFEAYGSFNGRNFELVYKRGKYKPSFLQQAYLGNHRFWVNSFRPVFADSFEGEYAFDFGNIVIAPTFDFDLVTDHIYFDRDTLPAQNQGNAMIISPGLKFKFRFLKNFGFDGNIIYTMLNDQAINVMPIPEIFVYSRLYYTNMFFKGNLQSFIGFDLNFKSAYYGQGYDPLTQQFYLQNHTLTDGFPVVNLFLNFKIKRANFFVKMNNLVQMATSEGYLVAPLYRGLPPTTDFGLTFWFFD